MIYNVGDNICSCILLQKCGHGAYGEVWLAEDAIRTRVALKIVPNGGRYSERELTGLKNYKDCNHPNLLKIRYVEITDAQIICIMDAADDLNHGNGEYKPDTLANRLRKYGRLDGKEITDMLDGLLSGLEELHKHGLVHRDIKPDNILWVNGRATLADVGLIAFEGAGSLVGTPGFLSPRVLEGNPAEASDDFYALGKVIYCALTGLAVSEYPSIPADMTISVDANLNKALRTSCSGNISSAAAFRQLLEEGKNFPAVPKPAPGKLIPWKKVFFILLLTALVGGFLYLFLQQQKMEAKHTVQPVERDLEGEKRLKEMQNTKEGFQKELQAKVQTVFKKAGWLNNKEMLPVLVGHQLMSRDEMQKLSIGNRPSGKRRQVGGALFTLLMFYPDFDAAKVRECQQYWRDKGDIKAMLTSDPLMQAIALDAMICRKINGVLERDSFQDNEQAELAGLIALCRTLLDPQMGELEYMSRKFMLSNR